MNIFLFGYGKMGKMVEAVTKERHHSIVLSIDECDACIDFSSADGVLDHVKKACKAKVPIVIGTTGWDNYLAEAKELVNNSGNAALFAPNFSIGVALFRKLLKQANLLFSDFAIAGIECHHDQKKDAPSGTAKAIEEELNLPSPFSSIRCGSIVGKHSLLFDSPSETITLTHEAKNREGFALGAVKGAEWIVGQKGWFSLDDMLHSTGYTV